MNPVSYRSAFGGSPTKLDGATFEKFRQEVADSTGNAPKRQALLRATSLQEIFAIAGKRRMFGSGETASLNKAVNLLNGSYVGLRGSIKQSPVTQNDLRSFAVRGEQLNSAVNEQEAVRLKTLFSSKSARHVLLKNEAGETLRGIGDFDAQGNGEGRLVMPDGTTHIGKFVNCKLQGQGEIRDKEGRSVVVGDFQDGICPEFLEEREQSAIKLQSLIRGRQVRKRVVMPSQIKDFLDKHLARFMEGKPIDTGKVSRVIAREILEHYQQRKRGTPESSVKRSGNESHKFPVLDTNDKIPVKSEIVKGEVTMWIKFTDKTIELELVGKELGKGGYKDVYRAEVLSIDMDTVEHAMESTGAATVVQRDPELSELNVLNMVRDTFRTEIAENKIKLAGILTETTRMNRRGQIEARDILYDGDLSKAQGLTPEEKLSIIKDCARSCVQFHAKGLVHRDVKPENIFVKGKEGFLADFDLTAKVGVNELTSDYRYWDALSKIGLVTPFSDIYGLAISTCESVFGMDTKTISDPGKILKHEKFKNVPQELLELRDAIQKVILANDAIEAEFGFSESQFKKLARLLNKNPQQTVQQLHQLYPAYGQFLALLTKA